MNAPKIATQEMNETIALSLALAESEIKRKQTESVAAQLRNMIASQQKENAEQAKKITELEKKISEMTCDQPSEAVN